MKQINLLTSNPACLCKIRIQLEFVFHFTNILYSFILMLNLYATQNVEISAKTIDLNTKK
jgi:hypothetical protein